MSGLANQLKQTLKLKMPPLVNPTKVLLITDLYYLIDLEKKYDDFLETHQQLLDLYNVIDELLDIRDSIAIQVCRLKRKNRLNEYYQNMSSYFMNKEYKCGCQVIQRNYHKEHVYCPKHLHYFKTKCILDKELTKINQELSSITNIENEIL
jgi:hypothetical protein